MDILILQITILKELIEREEDESFGRFEILQDLF